MDEHGVRVTRIVGEVADTCNALKVRRLANQVARLYNGRLSGTGLEITQFTTLCIVAGRRARGVQAIADVVGAERSTVARNLKILVQRGLLQEHKGRSLSYEITSEGGLALARGLPLWREAQVAAAEMLSKSKWAREETGGKTGAGASEDQGLIDRAQVHG